MKFHMWLIQRQKIFKLAAKQDKENGIEFKFKDM